MADWTNSDGLRVKYGANKAESAHRVGETQMGPYSIYTLDIDLTLLDATETVLNDSVFIGNDEWLLKLEMITLVAVTGDSEVDLGTQKRDRTELDYDGILKIWEADADGSSVGETQVIWTPAYESTALTGSGAIGAQMGTQLGESAYFSASNASATAFTAGRVKFILTTLKEGIDVSSAR